MNNTRILGTESEAGPCANCGSRPLVTIAVEVADDVVALCAGCAGTAAGIAPDKALACARSADAALAAEVEAMEAEA